MIYPIKNNETIIAGTRNVCLLLRGSISIEKTNQNLIIPGGSFFFFDSNFDIIAASPFIEGFVLKVDESFLEAFFDIKNEIVQIDQHFVAQPIQRPEEKKQKIKALLDAAENRRLFESYQHILWSEIIQDYHQSLTRKSTVEQFSDLIDQNLHQNYCAGTYAEMLDIPLKKLIREVRKSENKTPCNFITEKVIEKAKYLLQHSEDTSQMIAYQLGFDDPYYFIKYFKKNTDLTPTQYRGQFMIES